MLSKLNFQNINLRKNKGFFKKKLLFIQLIFSTVIYIKSIFRITLLPLSAYLVL